MYEFLNDKYFIKAKKEGGSFLFSKALETNIRWEDIFFEIEQSIEEKSLIKLGPFLQIVTHNAGAHLPPVADFIRALHALYPSRSISAHVYIGLTKFSESFGRHRDTSDVFFWQVLGRTFWNVYDLDSKSEYQLECGDVLYVPKSIDHEVHSVCPRAGISFGIDYGTESV